MYSSDSTCITTLIISALLGLIPAAIAHSKGKSFFAWWFFGAMLFIVALPLAIIAKPENDVLEQRQLQQGDSKKCPYCAEIIKREAVVCRYCGREIKYSDIARASNPSGDIKKVLGEKQEIQKAKKLPAKDPNYIICSNCKFEQWSGYPWCQKCGSPF